MTDRSSNLLDTVTPSPSSSSSGVLPRRIPGASGHTPHWNTDDEDPNRRVIPRIPRPRKPTGLAPRPAPPRQQLTARMAPLLRDLDWTRPADEPTTYDTVVLGYGEPAWKTAFGSAA